MSGHLVDELLEALATVLDEVLLEEALVAAERQLPSPGLAGQRGHDDLRVALQLRSQPLEVAVAPADDRLLQLEDGQVALCKCNKKKKARLAKQ